MLSLTASQILLEMAHLTAGQLSLHEVLRRISDFVLRVFAAGGAVIFLYDEHARTVTSTAMAATDGPGLVEENITLRLHEDSIFQKALKHRGVFAVRGNDLEQDILDFGADRTLFMVPLQSNSEVLGLLVLTCPAEDDGFDRDTLDLLQAVGNFAAVIINKARLIDHMERSEEKYRKLTENASDIVFTLDASGRFTFLNSRIEAVLGYTSTELLGTYFSGMITPKSWERTVTRVRDAISEGQQFLSYRWEAIKKDGSKLVLDVNASLLMVHGEYVGQQGIARDVSENRRLTRELARRQRDLQVSQRRQTELREYLALVTQVQEDERRRISRELHDDTAQALVALSRRLETCREMLDEPSHALHKRLSELTDLVDGTLTNLRRFCRELRPSVLDDLGLLAALEWLLDGLRDYGIVSQMGVKGSVQRLPSEIEVAVFRIVQEALNNVRQHAGPCTVKLFIEYGPKRLLIEVIDDGLGFDRQHHQTAGSLGLIGMHERTALLDGSLEVDSRVGEGTSVTLRVPIIGTNA